MTIGERIKLLRDSNNITQTELAEIVGTTKQNIYKYENGIITNIPSDKVELIAKHFHVSPAYIMGWHEEEWIIDPQLNNGFPIPPGHYGKMKDNQLTQKIKKETRYKGTILIPFFNMDDVNRTVLDITFGAEPDYLPLIFNETKQNGTLIYVKNNTKYNDFKDRMYPLIEENDIILLDFDAKPQNGDLIMAEFCPGKNFFCRYYKYNDFIEFQFVSHKPIRIPTDDNNYYRYQVRGIVKQIIKNT